MPRPPLPPVLPINDSVLLSGPALHRVANALRLQQGVDKRRNGIGTPHPELAELTDTIDQAYARWRRSLSADTNSGQAPDAPDSPGGAVQACSDQSLISTAEAAILLNRSERHMRRLAQSGGAWSIKRAGNLYFDRAEIAELVEDSVA